MVPEGPSAVPVSDLAVCLFIPAYNAQHTLADVIARIQSADWQIIRRVFIVNDGSTDSTMARGSELSATNPKVTLISFPANKGYGAAVKQGIESCKSLNPDFCVCLHADGQYPPEKIGEFISFMKDNSVDVLQGSRHRDGTALDGNMPFYKFALGKIIVQLENTIFGLRMTDYHSGYLFYSRRALSEIPFERLSSSFDFDLEVIASARARNLKIEELAIPTHYGQETSYLNPITYGLRVLRVLLRYARGFYRP
jgi:glycosyltransferase involved in cell wall biosynthesis